MCAPHARAAAAAAHLNHPPTRVHLKRSRLYALPLRRAKWDRRARSAGVELETAAHANGAGARPHVWAPRRLCSSWPRWRRRRRRWRRRRQRRRLALKPQQSLLSERPRLVARSLLWWKRAGRLRPTRGRSEYRRSLRLTPERALPPPVSGSGIAASTFGIPGPGRSGSARIFGRVRAEAHRRPGMGGSFSHSAV